MLSLSTPSPTDRLQGRLFNLAALFLGLYALALTLSPAVREHSWNVDYRWAHWGGLLLWLVLFNLVHIYSARRLPQRDPYLLPLAALLSGWGLLTVWRLLPSFGLRQGLWLGIAVLVLLAGLRLPSDLRFLRRYKYLWLTGSLLLTAATLLLGVNPMGYGPRMWLGCCGVYLQPSEPLKLLLIAYLAAYLADRQSFLVVAAEGEGEPQRASYPLLPLLAPTLLMTGLVLALLVVQRDLGAAFIFLFIYAAVIYIASGRRRIIALSIFALGVAGLAGYALFDVVRVRVEAWLNPWFDPSGRSYQIVQSLLAAANGGLLGRGPGMGSPSVVPLAHSDLVYVAVVEEMGLLGAVGLLLLFALFAVRSLRAALYAADSYRRYLAAGLTVLLVGQALLIIGGNLRLLPLTGVTLPFISYGGSSLLTTYTALLLLLHTSARQEVGPSPASFSYAFRQVGAALLLGLLAAGLGTGWWAVARSTALLERTDNPRRAIADRDVYRGAILDRRNEPISATAGDSGSYQRQVAYPPLSNIVGYNSPLYGQAGLEASMDGYLRGWQGNLALVTAWNHLLYGQPPPGLDIRLSLDLNLQRTADELLAGHTGALVLLNAENGEILAMASQPGFDANHLDEEWENLRAGRESPLLNRVTQGQYAPGAALGPFLWAQAAAQGALPSLPQDHTYTLDERSLDCALPAQDKNWAAWIGQGCPGAVAVLGEALGVEAVDNLYRALGLYSQPIIPLPSAGEFTGNISTDPAGAALGEGLRINPLQMALAAASLSSGGVQPAPHLVIGINLPDQGWMLQPASGAPSDALPAAAAQNIALNLAQPSGLFWESLAHAAQGEEKLLTWYLGGTLPGWDGSPLALVVLLEADQPALAGQIGRTLLEAAAGGGAR